VGSGGGGELPRVAGRASRVIAVEQPLRGGQLLAQLRDLRAGALQLRLVAAPVVEHVVHKLLEARLQPVEAPRGAARVAQ
jgi:hypothetical protein